MDMDVVTLPTEILELPADVLGEILGRTDNDSIVSFVCCSSVALQLVTDNREAILACRTAEFHSSSRKVVLAKAQGIFPSAAYVDVVQRGESAAKAEGCTQKWPSIKPASTVDAAMTAMTTVELVSRSSARRAERFLLTDGGRDSLESLYVSRDVEVMEFTIGGQTMLRLLGPVIRALAGSDEYVDVLPHTLGKIPLCAHHYHHAHLLLTAGSARVTFATWDPDEKEKELCRPGVEYNVGIRHIEAQTEALREQGMYRIPCVLTEGWVFVVTRKVNKEVVAGVLSTITFFVDNRSETIDAAKLVSSRWEGFPGVWQGLQRGYMWPCKTGYRDVNDVRVNFTLAAGFDPNEFEVTLACIEHNRMRVVSGMAILRISR